MDDPFAPVVAAHLAGDFEAARRGYEAFLPKRNAYRNLATLHFQHGYMAKAERMFRHAISQYPDDMAMRHALCLLLLSVGRFEEGWPLYEARRAGSRNTLEPVTDIPEWMGGPIAGKRIVVCGEQGFGDQIQFARYVWELQRRGAFATYAVDPELHQLFELAGLSVATHSLKLSSIPDSDYWVFVGSLPARLGLSEPLPLVRLGPPRRGGGGIGVMPSGNPTHPNDAHRSLPADQANRLLSLGRDLRPEATGARDFLETAKILAELDLVIAVDTSVAHLAGSMGLPTWVLLPAFDTDWRWQRERADSPWYPSATLFRQKAPGDWASVIDEVSEAAEHIRPARR